MMGWHHDPGWDAALWLPLCLILLAFLAAVVIAAVTARRPCRVRETPSAAESARRMLDERYAAGELDEAEYRRRRDVLGGR